MSRPSIHGFDLNCVDLHDTLGHLYLAGDEKMTRVLKCPNAVWHGVKTLCNIELVLPTTNSSNYNCGVDRAYLPELSLSNKAADLMNEQEQQEHIARGIANVAWNTPLLEGQLAGKYYSTCTINTIITTITTGYYSMFNHRRSHPLA